MAIDINGDIGDIFKSLFSKKSDGDSANKSGRKSIDPFSKVIVAGVVVFLLVIAYLFIEYFPTQEENRIKRDKITQINDLNTCIGEVSDNIIIASNELNVANAKYKQLTKLFHTGQELDDLYRHISMLALSNQLMISKINKAGESPVFEIQADQDSNVENFDLMSSAEDDSMNGSLSACDMLQGGDIMTMSDDTLDGQDYMSMDSESDVESKPKKVAYYELKVEFQMSGNYANYTKFREGLAKLKKIINITKEKIIVLQSENTKGDVKVETIFSIYRLPITESEKYAVQQEEML